MFERGEHKERREDSGQLTLCLEYVHGSEQQDGPLKYKGETPAIESEHPGWSLGSHLLSAQSHGVCRDEEEEQQHRTDANRDDFWVQLNNTYEKDV